MSLAPVCLFTYNRINETKQTVKALSENYLAKNSNLYIFSDGPKNDEDRYKVDQVRSYLYSIDGFKSVKIFKSEYNKGLADSIISGVTKIVNLHGKVIVLEDDLVTSCNFLDFMNQALNFYGNSSKVNSISGYTFDLPSLKNYKEDYYLALRSCSLGWGTWKNKWNKVDWVVSNYEDFRRNYFQQYQFFKMGTDLPRMLRRQMNGEIDSWAVRFCFHQFRNNLLTVYASQSKVNHIGHGSDATHATGARKFETPLDIGKQRDFNFSKGLEIKNDIIKEYRRKFSIRKRLINKIIKVIDL